MEKYNDFQETLVLWEPIVNQVSEFRRHISRTTRAYRRFVKKVARTAQVKADAAESIKTEAYKSLDDIKSAITELETHLNKTQLPEFASKLR